MICSCVDRRTKRLIFWDAVRNITVYKENDFLGCCSRHHCGPAMGPVPSPWVWWGMWLKVRESFIGLSLASKISGNLVAITNQVITSFTLIIQDPLKTSFLWNNSAQGSSTNLRLKFASDASHFTKINHTIENYFVHLELEDLFHHKNCAHHVPREGHIGASSREGFILV